nr:unnamed protein product [Haemonchus contortus]
MTTLKVPHFYDRSTRPSQRHHKRNDIVNDWSRNPSIIYEPNTDQNATKSSGFDKIGMHGFQWKVKSSLHGVQLRALKVALLTRYLTSASHFSTTTVAPLLSHRGITKGMTSTMIGLATHQ